MTALKKPLSVILAFVLVFALMSVAPIVAFAEDGDENEFTKEERDSLLEITGKDVWLPSTKEEQEAAYWMDFDDLDEIENRCRNK